MIIKIKDEKCPRDPIQNRERPKVQMENSDENGCLQLPLFALYWESRIVLLMINITLPLQNLLKEKQKDHPYPAQRPKKMEADKPTVSGTSSWLNVGQPCVAWFVCCLTYIASNLWNHIVYPLMAATIGCLPKIATPLTFNFLNHISWIIF